MSLQLDLENDFAQIFIVGYAGAMPEMLQLDPSGEWTMHIRAERQFATIGGGRYHAAMTYELLRDRGQLPDDAAAALREVTELAARYAPNCEPPVQVVKVGPSGTEEVQDGPQNERPAADQGKV